MDIIKTFLEGDQSSEKLYFKVDKKQIIGANSGSGSGSQNGLSNKKKMETFDELS